MALETFTALHGGYGPEIALIEYLSRVLLHLLAFGGVVVLACWGRDAVEAIRSAFVAERDDGGNER